jgi:transposase
MTNAKIVPVTAGSAVSPLFAGIDVGASELVLVIRQDGVSMQAQSFDNTPAGRQRLLRRLTKFPGLTLCLEATGVYYLDLALLLHDAGIRFSVLNPKASHNFAKVLLRSSKTDPVDADTLAQYAERMPYQAWVRPSEQALALRALARRLHARAGAATPCRHAHEGAAKNQLHALRFSADTPAAVLRDVTLSITQMEQRIAQLTQDAVGFIQAQPALARQFALLQTMKGVGETSAIALLGELLLLPPGLTHKQWVKAAGLDPREFTSGTSVHKRARLSKAGNRYIRQALYMPALSAKAHDPYVKGFFEHLIELGKTPLQALCAVMRKLLHAMHGMLTQDKPFDHTRFYALPN